MDSKVNELSGIDFLNFSEQRADTDA